MDLSQLWKNISGSDTMLPTRISINPENTDKKDILKNQFERKQQYFAVRVNEMFLTYERKWIKTFYPMVFVVSEFLYNGEKVAVPFVVGPSMLEGKMKEVADGMIFQDTTVAGLHPYNGGPFGICIVLARAVKDNYLKKLLNLIGSATDTYTSSFATVVNQYVKVGKVVLDSIESLLDSKDIEPQVGHKREFFPDVGDNFRPGYFALINTPENELDSNMFFVKENQLYKGDPSKGGKTYREHDFVLYSIMSAPTRNDIEILPFYNQWVELEGSLKDLQHTGAGPDQIKMINGKLFALNRTLRSCPDLTMPQAAELDKMFRNEVNLSLNNIEVLSGKDITEPVKDEWESKLDMSAIDILYK